MLAIYLLGGCTWMSGAVPHTSDLSKADAYTVAAIMNNHCRVPDDCTFGVEVDGRVFISPPPEGMATPDHAPLALPKSSPIFATAMDYGCIAFKGGGPTLTANDDCSLTGQPLDKPYLRLTLTRRYPGGVSKTMTWRVDAVHNTIAPLIEDV